ncbi:Crp/Fnr family transcriptional regulator [Haloplasma contractile]|uniref:Crp-family transcriptional regulator protein n=1 Tax=Haloplasma contractile SSD-17B TaxID=1033810 RepID=U2FGZ4_9MOLU|nr:Crp/Fnr family transcriptional regulator [Haloplasma contractile]ERJ12125.1 Crp-family transcriptional regulator protein [Haloplasma contractile SSD-17B]
MKADCCEQCMHQLCTKKVPIFSTLTSDELNQITKLIIRKHYKKGELLIHDGTKLENLVIINQGRVKAFRDTIEGKEQILYIFSSGDFFGEKNLFMNKEATYHVEALEETSICMIKKSDLGELLSIDPSISLKIMEEFCKRIERLENTIESMGVKNVESRINIVLLEFKDKFGSEHPKGISIKLPLSREGIAHYIGVTRETVSRKLSQLQDAGIIEMVGNKQVIILNQEELESSIK